MSYSRLKTRQNEGLSRAAEILGTRSSRKLKEARKSSIGTKKRLELLRSFIWEVEHYMLPILERISKDQYKDTVKQVISEAVIEYSAWEHSFEGYIATAILSLLSRAESLGINTPSEVRQKCEKMPSQQFVQMLFDGRALHPKIRAASQELFNSGHYSQAIFEACKALELLVKEKSGQNEKYGQSLMSHVFSAEDTVLRISSDDDEQEGFRFLFMGLMRGVKDPKSHRIVEQKNPHRALEYLSLASLLAERVDEAILQIQSLPIPVQHANQSVHARPSGMQV